MTDPHVELLDDARHEQAVADRARQRYIVEADGHDATFVGSLRSLSASGGAVLVETTVGRTLRGRVGRVSDDHVTVSDVGSTSYVRLDHLTAVRAVGGSPSVVATSAGRPSDTGAPGPGGPVAALGDLAHERVTVEVHLAGGATVRGTLHGVGADVLTVHAGGSRGVELVNLHLAAVVTVPRVAV